MVKYITHDTLVRKQHRNRYTIYKYIKWAEAISILEQYIEGQFYICSKYFATKYRVSKQ